MHAPQKNSKKTFNFATCALHSSLVWNKSVVAGIIFMKFCIGFFLIKSLHQIRVFLKSHKDNVAYILHEDLRLFLKSRCLRNKHQGMQWTL